MTSDRSTAPLTVSGVLLDIDDTLLDNKSAVAHAIAVIAGEYLPGRTDIEEAAAFFRADRHGHYRAFSRGEIDSRTQRRLRASDLHDHFGGPPLGDDLIEDWVRTFDAAYADGWRIHPDALPLLEQLEASGTPHGVLSNARRGQQEMKMAKVGLSHVPLLVCVDDHGYGKPDPRVFLEACRLLGTEPSATVYVGDEFDIDAVGAVGAGLVGVWCERPGAWDERSEGSVAEAGVIRVRDLVEFASLLAR